MRYETIDGRVHIFVEVEEGEKELDVLRAIVRSSYQLAHVVRDFGGGTMSDEMTDLFIMTTDNPYKLAVEMVFVRGRQCYTYVYRVDRSHFILGDECRLYGILPVKLAEAAQAKIWAEETMD